MKFLIGNTKTRELGSLSIAKALLKNKTLSHISLAECKTKYIFAIHFIGEFLQEACFILAEAIRTGKTITKLNLCKIYIKHLTIIYQISNHFFLN